MSRGRSTNFSFNIFQSRIFFEISETSEFTYKSKFVLKHLFKANIDGSTIHLII
jgi:hypothetical protein